MPMPWKRGPFSRLLPGEVTYCLPSFLAHPVSLCHHAVSVVRRRRRNFFHKNMARFLTTGGIDSKLHTHIPLGHRSL